MSPRLAGAGCLAMKSRCETGLVYADDRAWRLAL